MVEISRILMMLLIIVLVIILVEELKVNYIFLLIYLKFSYLSNMKNIKIFYLL